MSMPPASLLAFDTSTERMAVAVQGPNGLFRADQAGAALASSTLLPCIERLLADAGLRWADLVAIGFGRGPGAFTGLRTSCAVAQGLAIGLAKPLLPIDSLLIVAEDARRQLRADDAERFEVDVVMDARMGEVYAGSFVWQGQAWSTTEPAALESPAALFGRWRSRPARALAGSALQAWPDWPWPDTPTPDLRCATEADRAAALMSLARSAWSRGAGVDAASALPTYLRNKVALTTAERELARTTAQAHAMAGTARP